jgi:transposase InsO family protein
MYLLSEGLAKENVKKKKRRKWIRYERKHSMSAGHIDWHEDTEDSIKVCAILDDASRKILAGGEFANIKIEKWFDAYQRFRKHFSSFEEFVDWYYNRPHGSLNFEKLETPEQAFWRKMPPEAIFGIGHRLFGL